MESNAKQSKAKQNTNTFAKCSVLFSVLNTTHVYRDNRALNFNIIYTQLWLFIYIILAMIFQHVVILIHVCWIEYPEEGQDIWSNTLEFRFACFALLSLFWKPLYKKV